MANKITTLLDLDGRGWKSGLSDIKRSITDADGAIGKLKAGWGGVMSAFAASPVAIGAAGAAVGAFAAKAVGDASNLEESVNAVNVAYGESAEGVHALGEQSAESFGLSQRTFNEFSVQFSAFADKIAQGSGRDVVDVLEEMTTRTADFASVNNLDMAQAAQIMQSSLAGETEALRRYGGDVSAAAVETYALETGLIRTKSELTESIKVQARYGLLLKETAETSGDFANTTDGLANQQRILSANVEDLSASFGRGLIPIVAEAASTVNHLISVYDELTDRASGGGDGPVGGFVSGLIKPGKAAAEALRLIDEAAAKLDETLAKDTDRTRDYGSALAELEPKQRRSVEALAADRQASIEAAEARNDLTASLARLEPEQRRSIEAMQGDAEAAEAATAANEKKAEADEKAAESADQHREALEQLAESMEKQRSAALDLVGGDIAVRDAQRRAAEAAEELNDTLADQETSLAEAGAAIDEAADAHLNAAAAAADYRAKQMEANGQTVDARTKAQLMKEELQNIAGQLTGPLAAAIQGYINQLGAIPATVGTTIVLNRPGRVGDINPFSRTNAPRASGGPTYPGIHPVVENGPELLRQGGKTYLMSDGGGFVEPLGRPAGGSAAAGVVFNVVLQGVNSPEQLMDQLGVFVRRNGAGALLQLLGLSS